LEHPRLTGGLTLDDSSPQRGQLTDRPETGLVARASRAVPASAIRHTNIDGRQCKRSSVDIHTLGISSWAYAAVRRSPLPIWHTHHVGTFARCHARRGTIG
jgi:hypothetical protein